MTTNLLISINVDPISKSCEGCKNNVAGVLVETDSFCKQFEYKQIHNNKRLELCLSAQKQSEDLFNDAECTRTDAELVVHKELTEARALLNALAENHKMTITELHRAFLQESN